MALWMDLRYNKETKRRRGGNPPAEAKRFPGDDPRKK